MGLLHTQTQKQAGVSKQFPDGALGNHPAFRKQDGPGANLERKFQIMGGDQLRVPVFLEDVDEISAVAVIEKLRGFIQKQDIGIHRQQTGQSHASLFPA